MATPFRIEIEENDRSAFANLVVDETGLMVVDSFMGPEYPIKESTTIDRKSVV